MRRADGKPINVLVVDDEPVLAELVSMALRYEGWEIATAGDGETAIALARENPPDVVVLDVMLPDMSGLDVLRKLRERTPHLPLLLLTAKDSVEDRIAGLTAGGDDYVTKPFSLEEVVLRLRALLRRTGVTSETGGAKIVVGDLALDEDSHEVTRGGEPISLTATEFELLRFMICALRQHPLRVPHHEPQQFEFGRGQRDEVPAAGDLVAVLVERQVADHDLGAARLACDPGPPQQCA